MNAEQIQSEGRKALAELFKAWQCLGKKHPARNIIAAAIGDVAECLRKDAAARVDGLAAISRRLASKQAELKQSIEAIDSFTKGAGHAD